MSNELGIDCEFSRRDAYVFRSQEEKTDAIKAEVAAAKELGLPASFETIVDLPFPVKAAIKFSNQAQFHPRKFLLGLAKAFVNVGGVLYEHTEVTDIELGEPHVLATENGNMYAKSIVEATGEPFWGGDVLKGRMWTKMSYALAVKLVDGSSYPQGVYITTDDPLRTIRSSEYKGGQVLIYGGESHEYDNATFNPDKHYRRLIDDVYLRYDVDKVLYRWLAGDNMPYDRMPYIGPRPDCDSIYISTGYRAWGMAWAVSAAHALVDYIVGQPPEWAKHFSLERLKEPVQDYDKDWAL